ncbi:hypothetical protein [Peribacillus glennii]|uniref:hypothetical protein n=1 Tax=Peribacillus glennii TaxID=2303991 RepID=UPI0013149EC4|nr:hypothetical protein [Peribacillus glennii]
MAKLKARPGSRITGSQTKMLIPELLVKIDNNCLKNKENTTAKIVASMIACIF